MTSTIAHGQTISPSIDWSYLFGKWECTKATRLFEKKIEDITKQQTPYYCNFSEDLKYFDELIGVPENKNVKITVVGKYKIDKTKRLIGYTDLTRTIKYTDGAYEDYIQEVSKPNLTVVKLTNDFLILNLTELTGDRPGSYTYYFKKVK